MPPKKVSLGCKAIRVCFCGPDLSVAESGFGRTKNCFEGLRKQLGLC